MDDDDFEADFALVEEYRRRLRRRNAGWTVSVLVLLGMAGAAGGRPRLFGADGELDFVTLGGGAALVLIFAWTYLQWRCPRCQTSLLSEFAPEACPECSAPLRHDL